jgi:hypothetical protein
MILRDNLSPLNYNQPPTADTASAEAAREQVVTLQQIAAQFPSEWVLVGDPETDESLAVLGGQVLWHSKDRDEVYREIGKFRPKRFAMLYTGTMPEGTAIVL